MKEFKSSELEKLEIFSDSYDDYLKLKQFCSESETFETLERRIQTFLDIKFLVDKVDIKNFSSFEEFERFIFDNKRILMVNRDLNSSDKEYKKNQLYRLNFNHDDLKKIIRKINSNVTQPYLDKIISLFKKSDKDLRSIINISMEWIENKEHFLSQKIHFESYKEYHHLYDDINKLRKRANILSFLKKLPKSFQRNVIRSVYSDNFTDLETLKNNISSSYSLNEAFLSILTEKHSTYEKIYSELYSFNKKYDLLWERLKVLFVPFSKVVYFDNTKLIIQINSFFSANILGTSNWCLSRDISHWRTYVTSKNNNFYIVYNLKEVNNQMIGLSMSKGRYGSISYIYNQNNTACSDYQHNNRDLINALEEYNSKNWIMKYFSRLLSRFFIDLNGFRKI